MFENVFKYNIIQIVRDKFWESFEWLIETSVPEKGDRAGGIWCFLAKGPLSWGRLEVLKGVDTIAGTMQTHYIYENLIPSCHNQAKMFDHGKHLKEEY